MAIPNGSVSARVNERVTKKMGNEEESAQEHQLKLQRTPLMLPAPALLFPDVDEPVLLYYISEMHQHSKIRIALYDQTSSCWL